VKVRVRVRIRERSTHKQIPEICEALGKIRESLEDTLARAYPYMTPREQEDYMRRLERAIRLQKALKCSG